MIRRMRSIQQAIAEIKEADPKSCLSEWHLRQMVLSGELPFHAVGRKYLIDLSVLEDILGGKTVIQKKEEIPGNFTAVKMRRIGG